MGDEKMQKVAREGYDKHCFSTQQAKQQKQQLPKYQRKDTLISTTSSGCQCVGNREGEL
jgi:hypothetical protein